MAPPQLEPAPAVHPKQRRPARTGRRAKAAAVTSRMRRGADGCTSSSSIRLKAQSLLLLEIGALVERVRAVRVDAAAALHRARRRAR